jgi:hypothetical protein
LLFEQPVVTPSCVDGFIRAKLMASVTLSTLVVAGGASPAFMQDAAKAAAGALPKGQSRIVKDQTHNVAPTVLAPVLRDFFKGL